MDISSRTFSEGEMIPERCAYGRMGEGGQTVRSANLSPELSWSGAPAGTKSFAVLCIDDDVPTDLKARDASGELPVDQPRRRFVHWVQIEVAADVSNFPEGVFAQKNVPAAYGRPGLNDYCRGEGKPEADGTGLGYDGPCPPFFDARRHYYRYQVLALDLETLYLDKHFTLEDFEKTAKGHVLATAEVVGRYTLNPRLRSA